MKKELNILEILKDKPQGIRLYSPIFGECVFCYVHEVTYDICVKHNGEKAFFNSEGLYNTLGEVMLFPSKSMQDWSKFAWKKGDLLVNSCGFQCIFKEWKSDDYTKFNGCYSNSRDGYEDISNAETAKFDKLDHNIAYGYVREIERKLGGKLNLETLEIESAQPEFKDGDIAYADYGNKQAVFIVSGKTDLSEGYNSFIALDLRSLTLDMGCMSFFKEDLCKLRLAKEEEKKQLFDALTKASMAWDAEKNQIVDLKPKVELKPFDKVITRNAADDIWTANIFSHIDSHGEYVTIACVGGYTQCLPYNEETAKLIGTTKDVEG